MTTAIRRVTAPAMMPVTLDEAKAQCRVDHDDEDDYIESLIRRAVALFDGDGELGRAMVTQSWAQWETQAPGWVRLQMGPFISLTSVQYYDGAGVLQTATLGNFETWLDGDHVIVKPKDGYDWPSAQVRPDAIKITYSAGFGAAADVPETVKGAILLAVGHWYDRRAAASDAGLEDIQLGVDRLLGTERVRWYG